jgi:hypothetical protein
MSFIAINTDNPLGQRPLNLMSRQQGMGWLGAGPTPGDYDNNQQVLGQLVAMGAISQDDANNIWNGTASLDDMPVNMTMINAALAITGQAGAQTIPALPASSPNLTPAQVAKIPTTPASTAPPQIPPGTKIAYTVSWTAGFGNISVSPNSALAALGNALPPHGMSVVSGSATGSGPVNYGLQVTVLDSVGHAQWADAQSVLDALMKIIVGNNLSGSQIALAAATAAPSTTASVTTFLENNIGLIAAIAIGIVILPPLIKKI